MRYLQMYIQFQFKLFNNITSRPPAELFSIVSKKLKATSNRMLGICAIPFAVSLAKKARRRKAHELNLVVFVCQRPRGREAKLAYGLRSAGWKVILLYSQEQNFELSSYFDEVRLYKHEWEALSIACSYSPLVYHVFSGTADRLAAIFVKHKPGKVVFDTYDVVELFKWSHVFGRRIKRQRFCIENADGLCCRDLKVKYLARTFNYKLPQKVVFFPDYCWDFAEITTPVVERSPGEIHVVLAGSFGIEKRGFADAGYLNIAEMLVAQEIHFHIYPYSNFLPNKAFESEYIALSKRSPFLHLHSSLPMDAVIPELMKYDVGIAVAQFLTYGKESNIYNALVFRYTGVARVSDYFDAGLPVIANKEMSLIFCTAARYGVVIDGSLKFMENAREHLECIISDRVKEKIRKSRSLYSIRRHIGRLIAFYENL